MGELVDQEAETARQAAVYPWWNEATVLTTHAELDALPRCSVILDTATGNGIAVLQKGYMDGRWYLAGFDGPVEPYLPVKVLYVYPGTEPDKHAEVIGETWTSSSGISK